MKDEEIPNFGPFGDLDSGKGHLQFSTLIVKNDGKLLNRMDRARVPVYLKDVKTHSNYDPIQRLTTS